MKNKKGSIIKLIYMYFHKFTKHDIMGLSAEMGFYLLTALFPFLILLFIIATLISDNMQELLLNLISYLPRDMENLITELLTSFKGSMPIIITASVLGLWYMSNVISTLTKAMNRFYGVKETRGYFKLRGIFLLFALTIIVLIFLSFALVVFGQGTQLILQYLNYLPFISTEKVWNYMRYISVILVIFVAIMIMFKILPNKHLSFRAVAAGSGLTTAAWCITSYGFSFYVNNFSKYHVIYGSLASIFILVTWVYMSALVILIGASINAYWYRLRLAKRIKSSSL
ncbi:MAG: YihY/virulence factor BrkB family protein [Clostridia bacterium]|nr:YihY/virulence factor BrkB family protein [Clostridia bacterium]